MHVKEIDLSTIHPYPKNNRKHSEQQISRIADSIKSFGWTQPIVIDQDGTIVVGHGRYYGAMHLNLTTAPCVRLNGNLTKSQIRALRVLDNKLQNDSEWDTENVADELTDLLRDDFDLAAWGLDDLLPSIKCPPSEPESEGKMVTCPECGAEFIPGAK